MLAAEIWHWWIGVLVTLLVFGVLVALIAMYLAYGHVEEVRARREEAQALVVRSLTPISP